jgi:hypothetical protein
MTKQAVALYVLIERLATGTFDEQHNKLGFTKVT